MTESTQWADSVKKSECDVTKGVELPQGGPVKTELLRLVCHLNALGFIGIMGTLVCFWGCLKGGVDFIPHGPQLMVDTWWMVHS